MLIPGKYYHIYNRANGDENLFRSDENFRFFLRKYQLYINSWADTYAYCLMPNHFHLFLRVKTLEEIKNTAIANPESIPSKFLNFRREEELSTVISKQFSKFDHLYSQQSNLSWVYFQRERLGIHFVSYHTFKFSDIVAA